MKQYRLTAAAENDLFDISAYIALDNLLAADRLEADILNACQLIAEQPGLGHFRRDLTDKPVRFYTVRGVYLLVYDPETAVIIRVLHGARDASTEI